MYFEPGMINQCLLFTLNRLQWNPRVEQPTLHSAETDVMRRNHTREFTPAAATCSMDSAFALKTTWRVRTRWSGSEPGVESTLASKDCALASLRKFASDPPVVRLEDAHGVPFQVKRQVEWYLALIGDQCGCAIKREQQDCHYHSARLQSKCEMPPSSGRLW